MTEGDPDDLEAVYQAVRRAAANVGQSAQADAVVEHWRGNPLAGAQVVPLCTPTLPPATHTNCAIFGGERLAVIDPASHDEVERSRLVEVLDELMEDGRRVHMVLLTHHHADHIGAARYIADRYQVPVAAHPLTAERLAGHLQIDELIRDERPVPLGPGRALRVLFTPGHAPGHLCFIDEQTGAAAVGDMVAGLGTILIDPSEGCMIEYLQSLRRLASLNLAALVPAHGPLLRDPRAALEGTIAHRLWREGRVVAALSGGRAQSAAELLDAVYDDVAPAVHPIAYRSLLAHLEKLVTEGRARRSGNGWAAS